MNSVFEKIKASRFVRYFWDPTFAHYTWTGIVVSALNVFFLWLLIDILDIHTVVAGIIVVGGSFVLRYVMLRSMNFFEK